MGRFHRRPALCLELIRLPSTKKAATLIAAAFLLHQRLLRLTEALTLCRFAARPKGTVGY
jgi:hypothetical protein